jgi:hypothetical protein
MFVTTHLWELPAGIMEKETTNISSHILKTHIKTGSKIDYVVELQKDG